MRRYFMNMEGLCDITVYHNDEGLLIAYFGFKNPGEPPDKQDGKVEITITDENEQELYNNEFRFDKEEFFVSQSADKDVYVCDFKIAYSEIKESKSKFCNFSFKFKVD